MGRTAHSSYVNLDPTEYEYVGSYDFWDDTPMKFAGEPSDYDMEDGSVVRANNWNHAEYLWYRRLLGTSKTSIWDETGQCDHCGARMRYTVIMKHVPTGDHIAIGETCHDERFSHDNKVSMDLDRLHKRAAAGRALAKVRSAVDAWLEAEPQNLVAVEYAEANREENGFYADLLRKLKQYGPWTDRQRDAVLRGITSDAERKAKQAEREAEVKVPCPSGKITITGEVLKTEVQDNDWGTRYVMTVKDDRGFLVWGTIPSSLAGRTTFDEEGQKWVAGAEKGARVTFTATVEQSDRDECFGFYKRPSKASLV